MKKHTWIRIAAALCLTALATSQAEADIVYYGGGTDGSGADVYQGSDPNNAATAPRTNSDAMEARFKAAAAPTKIITFDEKSVSPGYATSGVPYTINLPLGVTYTESNPDGNAGIVSMSNDAEADYADKGYNTTSGGSNFLRYSALSNGDTGTFTFAKPIDAFGAYFTGAGTTMPIAVISFSDGSTESRKLYNEGTKGGIQFFGFTDFGKFITSVTLTGNATDQIGIDDVEFSLATPEPSTMVGLASSSLVGLGLAWRKRRAVA